MSRQPTVRYYPSRQGYFTQVNGKQHRLADGPDDRPSGPTSLKALGAFKELLDLVDPENRALADVEKLFDAAFQRFGRLGILVNNAGVRPDAQPLCPRNDRPIAGRAGGPPTGLAGR